jgi:hypothetical protein
MSPENPSAPLTIDHLTQLNNALSNVQIARNQIEKAKRVGIDVQQLEELNNANETKLRQIKQVYFPGQ